jgi:hypothetical protein
VEVGFGEFLAQSRLIGIAHGRIELQKNLSLTHQGIVARPKPSDYTRLSGLHDLHARARDNPAAGHRDDIERSDTGPSHRDHEDERD